MAVDAAVGLDRYDQAEVFIFNEGIESIRGFYAASLAGRSAMKEVQLPSTLKILEDSFNMLGHNLTRLVLPQGLEVIIDCFWSDMLAATGTYRENGLHRAYRDTISRRNTALYRQNRNTSPKRRTLPL